MRRRTFLAMGATGLAGALAGCSNALGSSGEWRLRAMRADPDATDHTCTLDQPFVDAHPNLESVLSAATDSPRGEWGDPIYLDAATGNELGADLSAYCEGGFRGLYFYDDDAFFVSLTDMHLGNGKGHDAPHGGSGHSHGGNETTTTTHAHDGNGTENHTHNA